MRLHDDVRRLVLAREDAQVRGREQRADVVRRVADQAVGEELLGVVVAVECVQQRGTGGLRGAVARQQPARPAAAARWPHARRHPLVGPAGRRVSSAATYRGRSSSTIARTCDWCPGAPTRSRPRGLARRSRVW